MESLLLTGNKTVCLLAFDFNRVTLKKHFFFSDVLIRKRPRNIDDLDRIFSVLNINKTHTFYKNSGIFINTPPTMDLALNRKNI